MIAEYLRTAYKGVFFLSDVRASLKLTIPQQVRSKAIQADGFACPDMMIFEARGDWHGMFLELKAESPFRKANPYELKAGQHLQRQDETLRQLQEKGYFAEFYWTFEDARKRIDWYLRGSTKAEAMKEIEEKIAMGTKMDIKTLDALRYGKD